MINYFIGIIALILGSIEDFRIREVPDMLSYALIVYGLFISLVFSILDFTWNYILNSLLGLIVTIIIGSLLYYSGQWGGGDFKLLMGVGTLLGVSYNSINLEYQPFLLFIINLGVATIVFGIIYVFYFIIRDWKKFIKNFNELRRNKKNKIIRIIFILLFILVFAFFLLSNAQKEIKLFFLFSYSMIYILYYFINLSKAIEKTSMIKKISVNKLTEGDWITHTVFYKNKKIYTPNKTGITLNDIKKLKRYGIKKVSIKQGMPLIPAFLIALLMNILFGNWLEGILLIF